MTVIGKTSLKTSWWQLSFPLESLHLPYKLWRWFCTHLHIPLRWLRQPARKTVVETNAWAKKWPYSHIRTTIDRLMPFLERVTSSVRVGVVKGVMLGHMDPALGFERWINLLWSTGIKGSWKSCTSLKILWLKCWVTETVIKMGLCGWLSSFTGHETIGDLFIYHMLCIKTDSNGIWVLFLLS